MLILFVTGIIAAAFSSADSALAALTTSFSVDILGVQHDDAEKAKRKRMVIHICISVVFALIIMLFKAVNNKSVIDAIYIIASYTYGPLLGLYAFGLFTRLQTNDRAVPYIAVAAPLLCRITSYNVCYTKLLRVHQTGSYQLQPQSYPPATGHDKLTFTFGNSF